MLDCGMHMGYNDEVSKIYIPLSPGKKSQVTSAVTKPVAEKVCHD